MCKLEERDEGQNGTVWVQHNEQEMRFGWCVKLTIAIAFLQQLGPPLLTCSCNNKKGFVFFLTFAWAFVS
jgi:hypothetical protein